MTVLRTRKLPTMAGMFALLVMGFAGAAHGAQRSFDNSITPILGIEDVATSFAGGNAQAGLIYTNPATTKAAMQIDNNTVTATRKEERMDIALIIRPSMFEIKNEIQSSPTRGHPLSVWLTMVRSEASSGCTCACSSEIERMSISFAILLQLLLSGHNASAGTEGMGGSDDQTGVKIETSDGTPDLLENFLTNR